VVERKGPKGFSFGKVPAKKEKQVKDDDRVLLYPNIDVARPNHRNFKAVMKKPSFIPPPPVKEEPEITKSLSPIVNKRKEGVSIAPLKYSHMSTEDLEKHLWN
jgi:hypothetical protein